MVKIGKKAHVNIKWDVRPVDYSAERERDIKAKFAGKYGISEDSVSVEPVFIKERNDGTTEEDYSNEVIDHIQEPMFQQQLFGKYMDTYGIDCVDFERIVEIDNLINNMMDYGVYEKRKKYSIKWIKWSNIMSYGKDNFIDFTRLSGLVLLTSNPANQGGKTTLAVDILKFLLYGKVTSRDDKWTLSKIFNDFLPDETVASVEGCISVNGDDYVIKRTVTRPSKTRRTDNSKVRNDVQYYRLECGNYIELTDEEDTANEAGSTGVETNRIIRETIGNEKDFDLMICVSSDNLKELISLKDTDRGRLISRWIGLLPIETKENLAKQYYKDSIRPKLISGISSESLRNANDGFRKEIDGIHEAIGRIDAKYAESRGRIEGYGKERDRLLQGKKQVDQSLMKQDVPTLKQKLCTLIDEGKRYALLIEDKKREIAAIGEVEYNKERHIAVREEKAEKSKEVAVLRERYAASLREAYLLRKGEYCPTCGQRLKDVDNSAKIAEKEAESAMLLNQGKESKKAYELISAEEERLASDKERYDSLCKLTLTRDNMELNLSKMRLECREIQHTIKDIEANISAIEENNRTDAAIRVIDESIRTEKGISESLRGDRKDCEATERTLNEKIRGNEETMKRIAESEKTEAEWSLYLKMVGKNGIGKMVIRDVIPLINSEMKRMLADVCDFTVEVGISDRNDVEFTMVHDGVRRSLASGSGFEQTVGSLALRSVLSRISTFSKPSFVVFDEILGGVSDDNYDNVKRLFDKIVKDYDMIYSITHLKAIADWHDMHITISKKNNVSTVEIG